MLFKIVAVKKTILLTQLQGYINRIVNDTVSRCPEIYEVINKILLVIQTEKDVYKLSKNEPGLKYSCMIFKKTPKRNRRIWIILSPEGRNKETKNRKIHHKEHMRLNTKIKPVVIIYEDGTVSKKYIVRISYTEPSKYLKMIFYSSALLGLTPRISYAKGSNPKETRKGKKKRSYIIQRYVKGQNGNEISHDDIPDNYRSTVFNKMDLSSREELMKCLYKKACAQLNKLWSVNIVLNDIKPANLIFFIEYSCIQQFDKSPVDRQLCKLLQNNITITCVDPGNCTKKGVKEIQTAAAYLTPHTSYQILHGTGCTVETDKISLFLALVDCLILPKEKSLKRDYPCVSVLEDKEYCYISHVTYDSGFSLDANKKRYATTNSNKLYLEHDCIARLAKTLIPDLLHLLLGKVIK